MLVAAALSKLLFYQLLAELNFMVHSLFWHFLQFSAFNALLGWAAGRASGL